MSTTNYNYIKYREYVSKEGMSHDNLLEIFFLRKQKSEHRYTNYSLEKVITDSDFMADLDKWMIETQLKPKLLPEEVFDLFIKDKSHLLNDLDFASGGSEESIDELIRVWIEKDSFMTKAFHSKAYSLMKHFIKYLSRFSRLTP